MTATGSFTREAVPFRIHTADGTTVVRELERHDVEVIQVDFSESHKFAIAGLHCATLELVRDQPDA